LESDSEGDESDSSNYDSEAKDQLEEEEGNWLDSPPHSQSDSKAISSLRLKIDILTYLLVRKTFSLLLIFPPRMTGRSKLLVSKEIR